MPVPFDAVRNLPGVQAAGTAAVTPLTGNNWTVGFERPERPSPAGDRPPDVGWQSASGGYFRALQIPLESGRLFSDADTPTSPAVVIVSDAIQQKFFDGQNAVGRKIKLGRDQATIVGVVGNIRRAALTDEPRADLYFAAEQAPQASTQLFVRTSNDPANLVPSLRTTLRSIEPGIVLREIATMEDVARESVQVTRLALWLLGLFAMTALALAAVGDLRCDVVRRASAHAGDRYTRGARRLTRQHSLARARAGRPHGRAGNLHGSRGRVGCRPRAARTSLQHLNGRSGGPRRSRRRAVRDRDPGVLPAGAPGHPVDPAKTLAT